MKTNHRAEQSRIKTIDSTYRCFIVIDRKRNMVIGRKRGGFFSMHELQEPATDAWMTLVQAKKKIADYGLNAIILQMGEYDEYCSRVPSYKST